MPGGHGRSEKSSFERLLGLFTEVKLGEGTKVVLLAANLCLLLLCYYLLKTIREPLVLGAQGGGAEVKSYASAVQAVLLVGVALGFGALARRFSRMTLITVVTLFFVVNLIGFYAGSALPAAKLWLGIGFFIWVGCFSLMIIAQFWAFANDLYDKDQGDRLFALIGAGGAIGAVAGAYLAKPLFLQLGAYNIMLIAAGILLLCLAVCWYIHLLDLRDPRHAASAEEAQQPLGTKDGFSLMLRDRYLLLVGALSLIKNWVNTTGEFILDRRLLEAAHLKVGTDTVAVERFIGAFKSDYFTWVNAIVLVLQLLAVSRIIKYLGTRRALFILPIVSLCAYSSMAIFPILTVIFVGKVAENSLDYSLQKTTEQTLFLVTSRDAKYKAKAIVDTFLVRLGDVASAGLVWVGTQLSFSTLGFIGANLTLLALWLGVVVLLARQYAKRERTQTAEATPELRAALPPRPRLSEGDPVPAGAR